MATPVQIAKVVRFGAYQLDTPSGELLKNGRRVRLAQQPFQVLALLLERPGELVTREELQHAIWPADTFVDAEVGLGSAVYKLRQALDDTADNPRFIETIPRRGYRFIFPIPAVSDQETNPASALPSAPRRSRFALLYVAVLCALAFVLFAFIDRDVREGRRRETAPVSTEAQHAYEMGMYEASMWTRDDLNRSVEYFQKALRAEPRFARAWAGLAHTYQLQGDFGFKSPSDALASTKTAALKAIEYDDSLAEAHTAMAGALVNEWSWLAAEREMRRALALDPNNADSHQMYGYALLSQARMEEGIAEMQRARALDPLSPNKANSLAVAYYYAGRYDDALAVWRAITAVEVNTNRRRMRVAFIYGRKKMPAESIAELVAYFHGRGLAQVAGKVQRIYSQSGYETAARTAYREDATAGNSSDDVANNSFRIAQDYALLGDRDRAFAWLNKAVIEHGIGVTFVAVEPRLGSLRSDPRFLAILRTVGVPSRADLR